MTPLVSAIITTFNGEAWLKQTIESALLQTYPEVEIVVCDDGSTDDSPGILNDFGARIHVVRQANAGVSRARNAAVAASRGDLLAFLDHDDLWEPQKTARQVDRFLRTPEVGLLFSDSWIIDSAGRRHGLRSRFHAPKEGHVFADLAGRNFIPVESLVVPRAVFLEVGGFDPAWHYLEDHAFCLRIAESYPIGYIDEPLASYRIHHRNLSHDRAPMLLEWAVLMESILKTRPGLDETLRRRLHENRACRLGDAAWHALRSLDFARAKSSLSAGGSDIPLSLRIRCWALRTLLAPLPPVWQRAFVQRLPRHRYYGVLGESPSARATPEPEPTLPEGRRPG